MSFVLNWRKWHRILFAMPIGGEAVKGGRGPGEREEGSTAGERTRRRRLSWDASGYLQLQLKESQSL